MKTEVLEKKGKKAVLLGNEAIVRGALEAGVGFASAYPGTPSSEVPIVFSHIAKKASVYFEYSSNEKVAFETAAGAAWCGVKAITSMKHFGLNVASDSVLPVAYTGVNAGLVVMVADDPGGFSSAQSEQDTRYYARMARMPMLEPSNPQECKEYTKAAFELSEKYKIPVFLRTTTKVSHSIGTVKLGALKKPRTKGVFKKDMAKYYNIKPRLQELHKKIDKKLAEIEQTQTSLNKTFPGKGKTGIITTGVSFEYCREAMQKLGLNLPVAKIGMSNPLSKKFISDFIKDKKAVLVLEELEPIIEAFVNQTAKEINPKLTVHGKDLLPRYGEYNTGIVLPAFEKIFKKKTGINFKQHKKKVYKALKGLPPRKPVFCPGCPHRSTFYAVKEVYGKKPVFAGDIGCYVLGIFEPYNMQDFCISMGASLGLSHGITKVSDQEVIVFIGDSTFFHASMPALANFRFNDEKAPLVIVMDNDITAMTGHQPHPGSGFTGMGKKTKPIKIEDVAESLGAKVKVASAFSQKSLTKALKELKAMKGLRILVSKGECRLLTKRKYRKEGKKIIKFRIDQTKCKKCGACTDKFACPAISEIRKPGKEVIYQIDPDICLGCSVCSQICPYGAIVPIKEKKTGKK